MSPSGCCIKRVLVACSVASAAVRRIDSTRPARTATSRSVKNRVLIARSVDSSAVQRLNSVCAVWSSVDVGSVIDGRETRLHGEAVIDSVRLTLR